MSCYCGFDSSISNAIMGLQIFSSAMNGVSSGLNARTNGATPEQAAFCGLGTALTGTGSAIMGNAINQGTHTYWGSTMSSFAPGVNPLFNYSFGNPFSYSMGLLGTNLLMSTALCTMPFGFNCYPSFYSYYSPCYHHCWCC